MSVLLFGLLAGLEGAVLVFVLLSERFDGEGLKGVFRELREIGKEELKVRLLIAAGVYLFFFVAGVVVSVLLTPLGRVVLIVALSFLIFLLLNAVYYDGKERFRIYVDREGLKEAKGLSYFQIEALKEFLFKDDFLEKLLEGKDGLVVVGKCKKWIPLCLEFEVELYSVEVGRERKLLCWDVEEDKECREYRRLKEFLERILKPAL